MKKIVCFIIAIALIATFTGICYAQDQLVTKKIESVTIKKDKNGNDYARLIVSQDFELNGIKYTKTIPYMVFGEEVGKAKKLGKNQSVKMIVSTGKYQDRDSFTVVKILD